MPNAHRFFCIFDENNEQRKNARTHKPWTHTHTLRSERIQTVHGHYLWVYCVCEFRKCYIYSQFSHIAFERAGARALSSWNMYLVHFCQFYFHLSAVEWDFSSCCFTHQPSYWLQFSNLFLSLSARALASQAVIVFGWIPFKYPYAHRTTRKNNWWHELKCTHQSREKTSPNEWRKTHFPYEHIHAF